MAGKSLVQAIPGYGYWVTGNSSPLDETAVQVTVVRDAQFHAYTGQKNVG